MARTAGLDRRGDRAFAGSSPAGGGALRRRGVEPRGGGLAARLELEHGPGPPGAGQGPAPGSTGPPRGGPIRSLDGPDGRASHSLTFSPVHHDSGGAGFFKRSDGNGPGLRLGGCPLSRSLTDDDALETEGWIGGLAVGGSRRRRVGDARGAGAGGPAWGGKGTKAVAPPAQAEPKPAVADPFRPRAAVELAKARIDLARERYKMQLAYYMSDRSTINWKWTGGSPSTA